MSETTVLLIEDNLDFREALADALADYSRYLKKPFDLAALEERVW